VSIRESFLFGFSTVKMGIRKCLCGLSDRKNAQYLNTVLLFLLQQDNLGLYALTQHYTWTSPNE